jgi:hypothetical protein
VQFNIRLGTERREELRKAARQHGVSLTVETAKRLGRSFDEERLLGGEEIHRFMFVLAAVSVPAGRNAANDDKLPWIEQPRAYDAFLRALLDTALNMHPGISADTILIAESFKNFILTRLANQPKQAKQKHRQGDAA